MVSFIMELLSNQSFILKTSDNQHSRLRRLKNRVPQGSVLSPILFNIYIDYLPETATSKYCYADDLAILVHQPMWKVMKKDLNQDMSALAAYLRKWHLKLSLGKTVAATFHLNNREARQELDVFINNKHLEFQEAPMYVEVCMDQMLSFKHHLEEVKTKVSSWVALIHHLAGTTWGAHAKILRISTQILVLSVAGTVHLYGIEVPT